VGDRAGPVYRSAGASRKTALIVLLVSVGVAVGVNGASGRPSIGTGVIGAI
jgi:hypothetical protein